MAVGVTVAIVFVFVGVAFRSVLVPLRAIFTITLTPSYVYGAAVCVYELNALDVLELLGFARRWFVVRTNQSIVY